MLAYFIPKNTAIPMTAEKISTISTITTIKSNLADVIDDDADKVVDISLLNGFGEGFEVGRLLGVRVG